MISISQGLARRLRAVFRRTLGSAHRQPNWVQLVATDDSFTVRAATASAALEYCETAEAASVSCEEPLNWAVPLDLLGACNGRADERLQLCVAESGLVTVRCHSQGVLQEQSARPPSELPAFPATAEQLSVNDAALLTAIVDAMATTDSGSSRYALGCINLRGASGSIAATDGRQLLVQTGFTFPWPGDVLVPSSKFFASRELPRNQTVAVGRRDDWVVFRTGPWTLWLRANCSGRFPQVDDLVLPAGSFTSHLHVSERDARFACNAVPRLPSPPDQQPNVTLDLHGETILRGRSTPETPPTELVLAASRLEGEPIRLITRQGYLLRALAMGLRSFHFRTPESFVQAHDDRRTYIWMPLAPGGAVPAGARAQRISSSWPEVTVSARRERTSRRAAGPVVV